MRSVSEKLGEKCLAHGQVIFLRFFPILRWRLRQTHFMNLENKHRLSLVIDKTCQNGSEIEAPRG
jgi:hypothetical protein